MKNKGWGKLFRQEARRNQRGLLETDTSERFVLRACLEYMERLLGQFSMFDKDTISMILWLLDKRSLPLAEYIASKLSGSKQEKFLEEVLDAEGEPEELSEIVQRGVKRLHSNQVKGFWRVLFQQMELKRQELNYRGASHVENSVDRFQEIFRLTDQEKAFFEFLYIVSTYDLPESYFVDHLECQRINRRKYLATALGLTQEEINEIMKGTLAQIEAFEIDRHTLVLEDAFLNFILNPSTDALSKYYFTPDITDSIPLEDHFLDPDQTDYVKKLLSGKSDQPVNILLYGPGGTGKTSFAYGLCKELEVPLYEIARNEENKSKARRAALHACLNMTANHTDSVILVDEADNVLNTRFSFFMRGETQDKGWLNQVLERKGARIIWITNDIGNIEGPVRRRFSYSLHFKRFNQRQRMKLWESILRRNKVKRFVPDTEISKLAKRYQVSAGAIDMAVRKATQVEARSKDAFIRAVTLNLDSHEALLNDGHKVRKKERHEDNYTLEGLNIDGDVKSVLERLDRFSAHLEGDYNTGKGPNMNLLFYGPPGTGKSELARYTSDRLDRQIIVKRASDILDPYVGMTERRIRDAFEEAEREEAVLVIDEIDSMLFTRDRAHRSWEISFTNEFLTQMESYRGILICTTNRLEDLDHACLRRFSIKLGFDYLKPEGVLSFYGLFFGSRFSATLTEQEKLCLMRIKNLAPGDFKVVRDKFQYGPDRVTHRTIIKALEEEAKLKEAHGAGREIGF